MQPLLKFLNSFKALIICLMVVAYVDFNLSKQLPIPFSGNTSHWQVGDLVLRMGKDFDSYIIAQASQSHYSHVGMVIQVEPEVLMIHATTDDDPDHLNQVIITPLSSYLSSRFASAYAIVRPEFLNEGQRALMIEKAVHSLGKSFILTDRNSDPFYCTTLVLESIQAADPSFEMDWQQVNMPLFKGDYLFPSAYLENPRFSLIDQSTLTF